MATSKERTAFILELARHLPDVDAATLIDAATKILAYGATSKRYAETACNYGLTPRQEALDKRNDQRIRDTAASIGCGVVFNGDPRGCTVKLSLPDGYTDDWAQTGFCVPTA